MTLEKNPKVFSQPEPLVRKNENESLYNPRISENP